jgi:hypothetical protein
MRIADSLERNGLDVQMADLERIVGAATAIEAESSSEPVAQRWRKRSRGSTEYSCRKSRK